MGGAGLPDGAAVLREWTTAADAWRKWRREFAVQSRAATELLLEAALVEPGMRILDLASGSGEPAVSLALAAGPGRARCRHRYRACDAARRARARYGALPGQCHLRRRE